MLVTSSRSHLLVTPPRPDLISLPFIGDAVATRPLLSPIYRRRPRPDLRSHLCSLRSLTPTRSDEDLAKKTVLSRLHSDGVAAKVLGKDTRGCTRAVGPAVSPCFLKNYSRMVNKIVDSHLQIAVNESEVEKLKKEMAGLKDFATKEMAKSVHERNVVSPRSANPSTSSSSSLPPSQDKMDIGKKCEVYGWGDILVAYGEVHDVDPKIKVHMVTMGEGNYKIYIETVLVGQAPLFRSNSQVEVADVVGSFTVWPKRCLKFIN